jgi:hypothetical protein
MMTPDQIAEAAAWIANTEREVAASGAARRITPEERVMLQPFFPPPTDVVDRVQIRAVDQGRIPTPPLADRGLDSAWLLSLNCWFVIVTRLRADPSPGDQSDRGSVSFVGYSLAS